MNPIKVSVERPGWCLNYFIGYSAFTVRKKDFIATGIRWFERWDMLPGLPPASHTLIITGEDSTEEAFGNGVKPGTLSAYLNDPNVALLVRRPRGWTLDLGLRIAEEASKHEGDGYGYPLIAAMFVATTIAGHTIDKVTKGWFGKTVERWGDRRRTEICSQLVAKANRAQPELRGFGCLKKEPYQVTPVMLLGDKEIYEPGVIELDPKIMECVRA